MASGHGSDGALVWEVPEDLIDLDKWARTYVELRVAEKSGTRSTFVRRGYWPIMALVVIVIGATGAIPAAVGLAVFVVAVFAGVPLWNRGAATRLANRLRNLPAASEAFTFRATATGTHSQSASGSEELSWSRYKSARLHGDLVVLTLDTDVMRMLPIQGLTSDQLPAEAVDTIAAWIEEQRSRAGAVAE